MCSSDIERESCIAMVVRGGRTEKKEGKRKREEEIGKEEGEGRGRVNLRVRS